MNNSIKILLVEDERMLAEILRDTLSDRNFMVHLVYDGLTALEKSRNEQYDVIVSDIMMPGLDGFSLVKELRSQGCSTPILFLTARSATEDVVKGFEMGGSDFFIKLGCGLSAFHYFCKDNGFYLLFGQRRNLSCKKDIASFMPRSDIS